MEPTRRSVAAVAAGGAVGAVLRYAVGQLAPTPPDGFPVTTLAINIAGAFALGLLVELLVVRGTPTHWARPLLGTGLLGGFTTFSTMTVELARLADAGRLTAASAYLFASVVGGVAAAWAGIVAAQRHPAYGALPIDPDVDE